MYQKVKKLLAALCIFTLVFTAMPAVPAKAATAVPKFKKTYANLYQNGSTKGKYKYTLTNLKKGQTVKWTVTGPGKSYVKWKKATTKVTGKTASNTFTVKTNNAMAAKNKKVTLQAEVLSGKSSLCTVSTNARIKVKPTKVTLTTPDEADDVLYVGSSYQFGYQLTPVNATCTNEWTVTGQDQVDYSSYMSSTGVFKPMKTGTYTIKMNAKIGSSVVKSASVTVEVADYIVSVKQTDGNKIEVNYSGDMHSNVTKDDFSVKDTAGASSVIKNMAFSADGKTAKITLLTNLRDGVSYTVSDSLTSKDFKASVGIPVKLEILTQKVTVDKETAIEYALYDENGVNVAAAYPGTLDYDAEVTNGYLTDSKKLYMTTIGKTATVTVKYTSKTEAGLVLVGTGVITCEAASTSVDTNFTMTAATTTPDYSANSYKDNRRVAIGKTYYAHFRALDTDKSEIKYTSIKYESSDPDSLIISKDGKVTPIRSGQVNVIITAVYADQEYAYSYDVTVADAPKLTSLNLSTNSVTMSNVYSSEYRQYIDVTALDQYSERLVLTGETGTVTNTTTSLINTSVASYDAANDRIVLNASNAIPGTYNYTLTLTSGGEKASVAFSVVIVSVSSVPSNAATTYAIEMDKHSDDLSLTTDVNGSRYVNVRLAQYKGGVFTNYAMFTSATVTKGSEYYGSDLTVAGTTAKQTIGAANRLSLKTLDITSDACRKASTGTYNITLQYYSSADKAYVTLASTLTLTDKQDEPEITIERVTASKSCTTALELAQNCLIPENGTITECVVTGETQPGSKVAVKAGDQINIKSVTVTGTYQIAGDKKINMTYTISIGKTLTNI